RVVYTVRPGGSHVIRRHAQMLQERGIVGAAAQVADRNIFRSCRWRAIGSLLIVSRLVGLLPSFIERATLCRRNRLGHIAHELLQAWTRRSPEPRTIPAHVDVEICYGVGQFGLMLFGPLGRADQALFFRVPARENQSPPWFPS